MSVFETIRDLSQKKEDFVSEGNFEEAMKLREQIDCLEKRVEVCYKACEGLKHPEFLQELIEELSWCEAPDPLAASISLGGTVLRSRLAEAFVKVKG